MRIVFFEIFLLVFCAVCSVQCEEATTTTTLGVGKTNHDNDDDDYDEGQVSSSSTETTDKNKEKDFDREEVIKILRSPEFDHEKEAQKLSILLHKFIREQQPLDDINKAAEQMAREEAEEQVVIQKTPEEIELDNLYEGAMKIMNKARGDKEAGTAILLKLAKGGHIKSEAQIAWYRLLNGPNDATTVEVRKTFERLAGDGLPEAHMVQTIFHSN